jgi:Domain of unknown function (DUF4388)
MENQIVTVPWQGSYNPQTIKELIEALCLESGAGRLTLRSGTQMASLYLNEGNLTDAHFKSLRGMEALAVLLGFEAGEYRFVSGLRSESQNLNGSIQEVFQQAAKFQTQPPAPIQNQPVNTQTPAPTNSSAASQNIPSQNTPSQNTPLPTLLVNPTNDGSYLPASFFAEVRTLLTDLRIGQPGVILARAMEGLGDDLSSIPKSKALDFINNIGNEIAPGQAKLFKQSITLTLEGLNKQNAPKTTDSSETRSVAPPTNGLRTVAATVLGRIPGPMLSTVFMTEIRQTLEQLRVFNAEVAIDRAAENLGFYPTEIPSSQTKKFLTAIISEITNEQGYQFQQLLDTTVRELEGQAKASKTSGLADRAASFPAFSNPLARGKAAVKPVDPAFEFGQSIQQNLKNLVSAGAISGLIQAAANDLGIQASNVAPSYAQKFVQAISQRLDTDAAQKFQRTMALSVGVYTAQR